MRLIQTEKKSAKIIMQKDRDLLENLDPNGSAILHLYEWSTDSATYGCFVEIDKFLHVENAKKRRLQLAKRPTGGGIIFHSFDLAFSFLLPKNHKYFSQNSLENYQFVNKIVISAIQSFLPKKAKLDLLSEEKKEDFSYRFCMAHPTKYDVMIENKKVVGAAQRRKKNGFLHQGSICLISPNKDLLSEIILSQEILEAISENSFPLLGRDVSDKDFQGAKKDLKRKLFKSFHQVFLENSE